MAKDTEHKNLQKAAHNAVALAIRRGDLKRLPCSICGATSTATYAHHDDYEKPLSIVWYCGQHHGEHHAGKGFKPRRIGVFRRIRESRGLNVPRMAKLIGIGAMEWVSLEKQKLFNFDAIARVRLLLGMTWKEMGAVIDDELDYLEKSS